MVVSFSPIQEALLSSGRGSFHMVRRAFGDCCEISEIIKTYAFLKVYAFRHFYDLN